MQVIVESTTLAARMSNRLLMALARESENSEDTNLKKQVLCEIDFETEMYSSFLSR